MKKVLVALFIFITSGILFWYLVNNTSPWNEDKINASIENYQIKNGSQFELFIEEATQKGVILEYVDKQNFIILNINFLITTSSLIALFYLIIDKLFFKKFFEEPDHMKAIRRSIILPVIIVVLNFFRIIAALNIINIVIILFLAIIWIVFEFNLNKNLKESQEKQSLSEKDDKIMTGQPEIEQSEGDEGQDQSE